MSKYHGSNQNGNSTFTKYLGVELGEDDTIMVEVIVSKDNGAIEVNYPEGRQLNTFERWAVKDEIEADSEIQDAIQSGEAEARHDAWIAARGFSSGNIITEFAFCLTLILFASWLLPQALSGVFVLESVRQTFAEIFLRAAAALS